MSVNNKSSIIDTELRFPGNLKANHSELLPCSSTRCIDIKINLVYIKYNKASQKFLRAQRFEHVFPVMCAVNLMRPHRMNIDYVHRSRDFINENEWADSAEHFLEFGW